VTHALQYLIIVAVLAWVVYRQFAGRFVPGGRQLAMPLVVTALGLQQLVAAHAPFPPLAVAVVVGELLLAAALGVLRGAAISLSARDGRLYQRGGWRSVGLWAVSIAARLLVALPFAHTAAGPALAASLTLSFGVSLAAQFLVLDARVRADGRPTGPDTDRRAAGTGSTLGR
jgi:hypothetical protein